MVGGNFLAFKLALLVQTAAGPHYPFLSFVHSATKPHELGQCWITQTQKCWKIAAIRFRIPQATYYTPSQTHINPQAFL